MNLNGEASSLPEEQQLIEAARNGNLDQFQAVLKQWKEQFSSPFLPTSHLASALAAATSSKHTKIVSFLLDQGATVSGCDMVLALGEDTEASISIFQTFLDHGWDINKKTDIGNVMLKHVVTNETLTRWFLAHGADVHAVGKIGSTILDVAAANSGPSVFDLLVQHGARLEDSDALHSAAGAREKPEGRIEMMRHLLELNVFDVNALERREYPPARRRGRGTPLHSGIAPQEVERLKLLLEHGADLQGKNTMGQTALEYAAARGFTVSEAFLRDAAASNGSVG